MASKINRFAAHWWAERLDDRHADRRHAFEQAILAVIPEDDWELKCDYDPWDGLLEAVRNAGISCSGNCWSAKNILPMKTYVIRRRNMLEFKEGYGNILPSIEFSDEDLMPLP